MLHLLIIYSGSQGLRVALRPYRLIDGLGSTGLHFAWIHRIGSFLVCDVSYRKFFSAAILATIFPQWGSIDSAEPQEYKSSSGFGCSDAQSSTPSPKCSWCRFRFSTDLHFLSIWPSIAFEPKAKRQRSGREWLFTWQVCLPEVEIWRSNMSGRFSPWWLTVLKTTQVFWHYWWLHLCSPHSPWYLYSRLLTIGNNLRSDQHPSHRLFCWWYRYIFWQFLRSEHNILSNLCLSDTVGKFLLGKPS